MNNGIARRVHTDVGRQCEVVPGRQAAALSLHNRHTRQSGMKERDAGSTGATATIVLADSTSLAAASEGSSGLVDV